MESNKVFFNDIWMVAIIHNSAKLSKIFLVFGCSLAETWTNFLCIFFHSLMYFRNLKHFSTLVKTVLHVNVTQFVFQCWLLLIADLSGHQITSEPTKTEHEPAGTKPAKTSKNIFSKKLDRFIENLSILPLETSLW